jgi:hypothetical protein
MRSFTAVEAASELKTDGRTLRRFLRKHPAYQNAGSGGRYVFTENDMKALSDRFDEWSNRSKTSKASGTTMIADEPGLPASIVRSRKPADVEAVKALSLARVERLEAALLATGLHISQMRKPGEGRWNTQSEDSAEPIAV